MIGRKGFLQEVTFRQRLEKWVMPRQAVGSRGHNYGLRAQPLQGQETDFHGQRAQKRFVGHECSGKAKTGMCFLSCLCVPFTHFSNGFLAFFLLIYRSSLCVMVIITLLWSANISPKLYLLWIVLMVFYHRIYLFKHINLSF